MHSLSDGRAWAFVGLRLLLHTVTYGSREHKQEQGMKLMEQKMLLKSSRYSLKQSDLVKTKWLGKTPPVPAPNV